MSPHPLLSLSLMLVIGMGLTHTSFADIRDDISSLRKQVAVLQDDIAKLDNEIVSQQNVIVGKEITLESYKKLEKDRRERVGSSWTSFKEHQDALDDLAEAERELASAKQKLQDLRNQRNDSIKEIDSLKIEIKRLQTLPPEPNYPGTLYGISLDSTCLALLKTNMTTDCPTYEEIGRFFPDMGCPLAGKSCLDWHMQTGDGAGYILNPDMEIRNRIPNIEIRSDFAQYHLDGIAGYNAANHTLIYGLGRYVNPGCTAAFIDSADWPALLGDSVMYLDSHCTKTYRDSEYLVQLNRTEHDITTSYKWQLEKWVAESREKCINKCFEY